MTVFSIFDSATEQLFARAAVLIAHHLTLVAENKPSDSAPLTLGLCGGRSILGLLKPLTDSLEAIAPRLQFYMADERLVPLSDAQSNFYLLNRELFQPLLTKRLIQPPQIHPFQEDTTAPGGGAGAYSDSLFGSGGRFDICFLGVGEDGHVASLFPGKIKLSEKAPFYLVEDSPKPPPRRLTASADLIGKSYLVVVLFIGEGKRKAYERFMDPAISVIDCPAKLALNAENTLILSDLRSEDITEMSD